MHITNLTAEIEKCFNSISTVQPFNIRKVNSLKTIFPCKSSDKNTLVPDSKASFSRNSKSVVQSNTRPQSRSYNNERKLSKSNSIFTNPIHIAAKSAKNSGNISFIVYGRRSETFMKRKEKQDACDSSTTKGIQTEREGRKSVLFVKYNANI